MAEKVVLTSSSRDAHGVQLSAELLNKAVDAVNGEYKMRYLANHKREYPLLGYMDNAEMSKRGDIDIVSAEPILYQSQEQVAWDPELLQERPAQPVKLKMRDVEIEEIVITLDPNNYAKPSVFFATAKALQKSINGSVIIKTDTRKNFLPEPRIIIGLTAYYTAIHPFIKPLLVKMGEKFAEETSADLYEFTKGNLKKLAADIRNIAFLTRKNAVPQNKPQSIIFELPGVPFIELHAKTDNLDLIAKGLTANHLAKMHKRVSELGRHVDIAETHFSLSEKGSWKFTYLITTDGVQIGTKTIFAKRDKLMKRIELSPTRAHSIGADVDYDYSKVNNNRV